ncbi:hypothetical protein GCM10028771_00970 [Nocardioides marmoraquaticus]
MAAAVVLALALGGCGGGEPAGDVSRDLTAPTSGGRLPDVRLASLDGDDAPALDLASLRGPVVVNLWASWCGPCKAELPIYADFAERHGDRVAVVGVDYEETSVDAARALAERSGVTYPLYADPDGELRAVALPKLLLVDEGGEVALEQYVEITSRRQLEDLVGEHLGVRL